MTTSKDILTQIFKRLDTIEKLLTGNGDSAKGLIVRVDRVEGAQKRHQYFLGAFFGIFCTAVTGIVVSYVTTFFE